MSSSAVTGGTPEQATAKIREDLASARPVIRKLNSKFAQARGRHPTPGRHAVAVHDINRIVYVRQKLNTFYT